MRGPEIRAAGAEPDGWTLDGARTRWCGRADAENDAPRLCFTLEDAGFARAVEAADPVEIASFVTQVPMPAGLLASLAERCLERAPEASLAIACGQRRVDLRWERALASAAVAKEQVAIEDTPGALEVVLEGDGEILQMVALDDGGVAVLERREVSGGVRARVRLWRDGATTELVDVPIDEKDLVALPRQAHADAAAVVFTWLQRGPRTVTAWVLATDGKPARVARVNVEAVTDAWSLAGDRLWLHTRLEHLVAQLADGAPPAAAAPIRRVSRAQPAMLSPVRVIDGWLLAFGGGSVRSGHAYAEELRWVKLDGSDDDRTRPWYQDVRQTFVADGHVWAVNAKGVWGWHPTAEPRFRWAMGPMVAAVDGPTLWFSFHNAQRRENGIACVDLPTSGEHWRHVLPERPGRIERVPGGVVTAGQAWWWIADDGRIVESGRGFLSLTLGRAGGSRVFSTGDELIFVGADGALVRRVALEARAQLVGSTGACVIATTPTTLHAFDERGHRVARLPRKQDELELGSFERANDDKHRLVDRSVIAPGAVFFRGAGKLLRFVPPARAASGPSVLPPPARLPVVRDERLHHTVEEAGSRGPVSYTEPGLALAHAWHVGLSNTYVGDPDEDIAAVDISDGTVVTLVGCTIEGPIEVRRASTLVLIGCTETSSSAFLDEGCFVVRVG